MRPAIEPRPAILKRPFLLDVPSQSNTPDGPAATAPKNDIDLTALRYYAGQRDLQRVGAEIRRIKALHPGWEPPADLFVPPSNVNEQPLWDLFAAGGYAEERAQIEALKRAHPTWTPSQDLMAKLAGEEAAQMLKAAYNAGNWQQVVSVAGSHQSLLLCGRIELLWDLRSATAPTSSTTWASPHCAISWWRSPTMDRPPCRSNMPRSSASPTMPG